MDDIKETLVDNYALDDSSKTTMHYGTILSRGIRTPITNKNICSFIELLSELQPNVFRDDYATYPATAIGTEGGKLFHRELE